MLRSAVILLLSAALASSALAQNERPIVGTAPFFGLPTIPAETIAELQALVTTTLLESDRFDVVEVERLDDLSKELYAQGDESYLDGVVSEVAPMGAQSLLLGTVADVNVTTDTNEGVRTYSATVNYDLRKVNVGTREVECHAQIRSGLVEKAKSTAREGVASLVAGRLGGKRGKTVARLVGADTPEAALSAALDDTKSQVEDFITSCFPQTLEVLAIEKEGEDGLAEEVLIAGANAETQLSVGAALQVVEKQQFELSDGTIRIREVPIATLSVKDVQGGGFAVCTVDPGGREQLTEALEEGAVLVVTTEE